MSSVDVTFNEIVYNEIFVEGWIDDTLWVDDPTEPGSCFNSGGGFQRCKIEGR